MNRASRVLTLSLLVNLLLLGFIVGHTVRYSWKDPVHSLQEFTASLPAEKQKLLAEEMEKFSESMDKLGNEINEQRKGAENLLLSQPFDRQAYLTQMQHIYDLKKQIAVNWSEMTADIAQQCTPPERETLVQMIRRHKPGK